MSNKTANLEIDYSRISACRLSGQVSTYPLVIAVPHAGSVFPQEFLDAVKTDLKTLRGNEDLFVDELVAPLADKGIPVLKMNVGRSFIDANRDKVELDPQMFYDFPSDKITIENNRCRFGLGLIHRIAGDNKPIYHDKLSYREVQLRIKNVYDVYHRQLQRLVGSCVRKFGFCVVLDCHSMPSKICNIMPDSDPMDFCIGDLFSQSCPPQMSAFFHQSLQHKGYVVTDNVPYSGAYTTFNYCRPRQKNYSLQLEINRKIYANEKSFEKNSDFQKVSSDICNSVIDFANFLLDF